MTKKKAVRDQTHTPYLALEGVEPPCDTLPVVVEVKPMTDLQLAIDAFDREFFDAYGQKPTWNAKHASQVKRLVASLGSPELVARIRRLFAGALGRWPEPPYTLAVLVGHIDRLVIDKTRPAKPSELLRGGR